MFRPVESNPRQIQKEVNQKAREEEQPLLMPSVLVSTTTNKVQLFGPVLFAQMTSSPSPACQCSLSRSWPAAKRSQP